MKKVHSIYNNNNYNDNIISIYQSRDEIHFQIKKNIEYDEIKNDKEYSIDAVDNLVNLICNTVASNKKIFKIGKEDISADTVKKTFMDLRKKHIEYVIDCVSGYSGEIRNMNAYLLTALYNAENTIDVFWQHKLNREIPILVAELEKRKKLKVL